MPESMLKKMGKPGRPARQSSGKNSNCLNLDFNMDAETTDEEDSNVAGNNTSFGKVNYLFKNDSCRFCLTI